MVLGWSRFEKVVQRELGKYGFRKLLVNYSKIDTFIGQFILL